MIGVPLTAITNATIPIRASASCSRTSSISARSRALLDMDPKLIETADRRAVQGQGKAARRQRPRAASRPRLGAAEPEHARSACGSGSADKVGDRIFIEGNSAAALGAVYGGATVCAWYPITPSSSLADAFTGHCKQLRHDRRNRQGQIRHRPGRGRTRLDRHRDRRRPGTAPAPSPRPPAPASR